MSCHTHFTAGKRVLVILNDGSKHVDKFVERLSKFVVLESLGRVPVKRLKSITIYRQKVSPTNSKEGSYGKHDNDFRSVD